MVNFSGDTVLDTVIVKRLNTSIWNIFLEDTGFRPNLFTYLHCRGYDVKLPCLGVMNFKVKDPLFNLVPLTREPETKFSQLLTTCKTFYQDTKAGCED
eukprot:augustus_masked-scaffold_1-processed-gene-6.41-mRNA-1 protein AED:1.00 eAED:1.00 QI:0/-1/0/0/-1/1/1/0/97